MHVPTSVVAMGGSPVAALWLVGFAHAAAVLGDEAPLALVGGV